MDLEQKITILADAAKYDASCASSGSYRKRPAGGLGNTNGVGICHSYTPDGRCISLLKLLLTNHCIWDCKYCVNRKTSDTRRTAFKVEEVVSLTMEFYRRNYIEGLFLSSGVMVSPDFTMERLIRIARTLRLEHKFGGYIHLKAVPGASQEILAEAGLWADRLSANIEMPAQEDLDKLAPEKTHRQIEQSMDDIDQLITTDRKENPKSRERRRFAPGGQSTQMIVGATPTPDSVILHKAETLYHTYHLRRVYYSAYSPIPFGDAELSDHKIPLMREHRLYQADWLMRFYGFKSGEILPAGQQALSLERDPKMNWAINHPEFFPVNINTAPREMLLRVPGIGVRSVQQIIAIRRHHQFRLNDLKKLKVALNRAKDFIITVDHLPMAAAPAPALNPAQIQLELFQTQTSTISGEI